MKKILNTSVFILIMAWAGQSQSQETSGYNCRLVKTLYGINMKGCKEPVANKLAKNFAQEPADQSRKLISDLLLVDDEGASEAFNDPNLVIDDEKNATIVCLLAPGSIWAEENCSEDFYREVFSLMKKISRDASLRGADLRNATITRWFVDSDGSYDGL